ncbi:hypothetical protein BUALT_Bualt06G0050000 [Buddleja alternifolia]|uniref:Jacalin-type lectin domain-containing protein n=1 Tax=Buddleja alternifolia TaxID=168488 RepID=A0AAV6XKS2_9LAMI|nr:hypothetical protein BUALT_Bualt06G0050000 [Buddleja alternifolia]
MVHMGKTTTVGPWGGNGQINWDDGSYDGVRIITLEYGKCINTIQVIYDKNGKLIQGARHGNVGGHPATGFAQIILQYPEEILTTVSGYYSKLKDYYEVDPIIRSLTFKTNMGTYGPYGVEEGAPFSASFETEKIVGFLGKSGWYLDAIGFHITPTKKI